MIALDPKMTVAVILTIVEEIQVIVAVIEQMTETIIATTIVQNQEMTVAVIPAAGPVVEISEVEEVDKIIIVEVDEIMTEAIIVDKQKMTVVVIPAAQTIVEIIIEEAAETVNNIMPKDTMALRIVKKIEAKEMKEDMKSTITAGVEEIVVVEEQLKIIITIDL